MNNRVECRTNVSSFQNDKQMTNGSRSPHENGNSSKLSSALRHKQSNNDDSSRSPHSDNGSTRSTPSQKVRERNVGWVFIAYVVLFVG